MPPLKSSRLNKWHSTQRSLDSRAKGNRTQNGCKIFNHPFSCPLWGSLRQVSNTPLNWVLHTNSCSSFSSLNNKHPKDSCNSSKWKNLCNYLTNNSTNPCLSRVWQRLRNPHRRKRLVPSIGRAAMKWRARLTCQLTLIWLILLLKTGVL